MAFATITACLSRILSTGGKKNLRITGWNMATRGSSSATIRAIRCFLAGAFSRKVKKRAGLRRKRFWPSRMIRSSPVTTPTPLTLCGCGMRRPVVKSTSVNSTRATTLRRWKIKTTLRTFHGCSTRTIPPIPDESCACARSIFWSRRRYRISCTVIINCIKPMRIWRIKSPFTSMIRIRCFQFRS